MSASYLQTDLFDNQHPRKWKFCQRCGATMRVKPSHYDKKVYCGVECMAIAYRERMRGEANPNYRAAGVRACPHCGATFRSYNKRSKYCSKICSARANAADPNFILRRPRPKNVRPKIEHPKPALLPRDESGRVLRKSLCSDCGEIVWATHPRRYCSSCWPRKKEHHCVICGGSFTRGGNSTRATCSEDCSRQLRTNVQQGELSHRWKGGITNPDLIFRCSKPYQEWRQSVFKCDDYTCALCNKKGGKLAAHHIKPFGDHRELALEVWNGITLCWPCHTSIRWKEAQYEGRFFAITKPPPESEKGRASDEQKGWLADFRAVGVDARIVRPSQRDELAGLLRG